MNAICREQWKQHSRYREKPPRAEAQTFHRAESLHEVRGRFRDRFAGKREMVFSLQVSRQSRMPSEAQAKGRSVTLHPGGDVALADFAE